MQWLHKTSLGKAIFLCLGLLLLFTLAACQVPAPSATSMETNTVATVVPEEGIGSTDSSIEATEVDLATTVISEQTAVAPTDTVEPANTSTIDIPRISVEDTKARLDAGQAVIVDVRTSGEFERGHIPGAVSIPRADFDDRFAELSQQAEILLYCT